MPFCYSNYSDILNVLPQSIRDHEFVIHVLEQENELLAMTNKCTIIYCPAIDCVFCKCNNMQEVSPKEICENMKKYGHLNKRFTLGALVCSNIINTGYFVKFNIEFSDSQCGTFRRRCVNFSAMENEIGHIYEFYERYSIELIMEKYYISTRASPERGFRQDVEDKISTVFARERDYDITMADLTNKYMEKDKVIAELHNIIRGMTDGNNILRIQISQMESERRRQENMMPPHYTP